MFEPDSPFQRWEPIDEERAKGPGAVDMKGGDVIIVYALRALAQAGVLMGGVPGVGPAEVAVIGGGVVGTHAARIAAGMGAKVTVLDKSLPRLRYLDDVFGDVFQTRYASAGNTAELVNQADMVIGAVLIPGAAAPKLVTKAQLSDMKPGAAIVDVAIDQGGCFETSRATTHQDPISGHGEDD